MGKINGAIDRVNDPLIGRLLDDLSCFLGQDLVIGKMGLDDGHNGFFSGMIGLGHQVIDSFFVTYFKLPVEEPENLCCAGSGSGYQGGFVHGQR